MSTSSDGHKAGRVEDPLVLRKKYDHAKARLRDKADELGDAQVGYEKAKKKNETLERKNETLERMMTKMKADLIHTEEILERTRRQGNLTNTFASLFINFNINININSTSIN
ncbi:hypothetical protein BGZ67_005890 [Mortierella alpina]|nr:hypothetical protein BGZ67_005890 [Mortierella alpina]